MKRFAISICLFLLLLLGQWLIVPFFVYAEDPPNVKEISNIGELRAAIAEINESTEPNLSYLLELKADIVADQDDKLSFDKGSTTIKGNGHSLSGFDQLVVSNGAIVHLGETGDTLRIDGGWDHPTSTPRPLLQALGGGTINMHEGTIIDNRDISHTNSLATVVLVQMNGIFNMLGGSIQNCKVSDAGGMYDGCQSMICVNKGTFNMSGGSIKNNRVKRLSSPTITNPTEFVRGAAVCAFSSMVNISGGSITDNQIITDGCSGYGAALFAWGSTVNVSGGSITDNQIITDDGSGYGAGIFVLDSDIRVSDTQITGNSIDGNQGYGGGIFAQDSDVSITNSLVAFNSAGGAASDVCFSLTEDGTHSLNLPSVEKMNERLAEGDERNITGWYHDNPDDRYSESNPTEQLTLTDNLNKDLYLVAGYSQQEPDTIDISAQVNWDDQENAQGLRPQSITIGLLENGNPTGKSLRLSHSNNWRGSLMGLPQSLSGSNIEYDISVEDIGHDYYTEISGNASTGFLITAHLKPVEPQPDLPAPPPFPDPIPSPIPSPSLNPDFTFELSWQTGEESVPTIQVTTSQESPLDETDSPNPIPLLPKTGQATSPVFLNFALLIFGFVVLVRPKK
ncbi:MAG: Cna B-type domain-containing protein [Eubacteriales bacterium]|nr:Cna B-type domain-containing protein [Eubacteriales bacterium]